MRSGARLELAEEVICDRAAEHISARCRSGSTNPSSVAGHVVSRHSFAPGSHGMPSVLLLRLRLLLQLQELT